MSYRSSGRIEMDGNSYSGGKFGLKYFILFGYLEIC